MITSSWLFATVIKYQSWDVFEQDLLSSHFGSWISKQLRASSALSSPAVYHLLAWIAKVGLQQENVRALQTSRENKSGQPCSSHNEPSLELEELHETHCPRPHYHYLEALSSVCTLVQRLQYFNCWGDKLNCIQAIATLCGIQTFHSIERKSAALQ